MPFQSVDQLQNALSSDVFHYATDKKKAAGRALGTLVEVITFYLLKAWDLHESIAIERPLAEYSNSEITHNVEYSIHPRRRVVEFEMPAEKLPLSVSKIIKEMAKKGIEVDLEKGKSGQLLSAGNVVRNACTVANDGAGFFVATLAGLTKTSAKVAINRLTNQPFAMAECKRVGVEEGNKKGPQTIEKAKQGAYVARTVSALQRLRLPNGEMGGVMTRPDGRLVYKEYDAFVQEIVKSDSRELLRHFILTVGVVSNHGNWFTSENPNKELKVLAQSYDWLVFLTDAGLAQFIEELILKPSKENEPARDAFRASYTGTSRENQFTKVRMAYDADRVLQKYFTQHLSKVESWFNVISPKGRSLKLLRDELRALSRKSWGEIHK